MKFGAVLAILVGIILVGCSNHRQAGVEQSEKIDVTMSSPTLATPTTEPAPTEKKVHDLVLPLHENHFNKGLDYAEDGQWENAVQEFDKAIQVDPDYAEPYYNRGYSYDELGQYQTAIDDYTMAIQLDPDYAEAYANRGNTYDTLGQYEQALLDLNTAIQINPNEAWAHYIRAFVYRNLGQNLLANSDDAKACSLDNYYC